MDTNVETSDHAGAQWRPSPNFGDRRDGASVRLLVLHYTGMEDGQSAEDWLCNPASEVSSHYVVHEDGRIVQLVAERDRAWHAGKSCWSGIADINSHSVGIEIVNGGHPAGLPAFPDAQIGAVIELSKGIIARHGIAPRHVLAHSDVAPGRKIDPGERFPWHVLHGAGIGIWIEPIPIGGGRFLSPGDEGMPVEALQGMLALYGYDVPVSGVYCQRTKTVVEAFQRHFRPARIDGVADSSTIESLYRLNAAVSV